VDDTGTIGLIAPSIALVALFVAANGIGLR